MNKPCIIVSLDQGTERRKMKYLNFDMITGIAVIIGSLALVARVMLFTIQGY